MGIHTRIPGHCTRRGVVVAAGMSAAMVNGTLASEEALSRHQPDTYCMHLRYRYPLWPVRPLCRCGGVGGMRGVYCGLCHREDEGILKREH